jgi:hypothetical protein
MKIIDLQFMFTGIVMRGENVSSALIHVRSLMEIASWQWQALMA